MRNDTPTKKTTQSPNTAEGTQHESHKILLTWDAPEYIRYHKSPRWYLTAVIIVIITAVIALLTDNWSMALATITLAGVYQYIHKHHPPKMMTVSLTDMGIAIGKKFIPYSHIQAFWIIYHEGIKTLNLRVMKSFYSDTVIHFNGQDPAEVRRILVSQIPEWEGKNERLSDVILRLLRL